MKPFTSVKEVTAFAHAHQADFGFVAYINRHLILAEIHFNFQTRRITVETIQRVCNHAGRVRITGAQAQ